MTTPDPLNPTVRFASFVAPTTEDRSTVLRIAPLLQVIGKPDERTVVTGTIRIVVAHGANVSLTVDVANVWVEVAHSFAALEPESDGYAKAREVIRASLKRIAVDSAEDEHTIAARLAKDIAESSRNSVAAVRELRYELENLLSQANAPKTRGADQISVVSSLLQLNVITSRAADVARESVREGLWLWACDDDAYQSYRRLQDATIINEYEPATAQTRTWMRRHDAAIRQCLDMRKQLDAESTTVQSLLAAASSVSSSREADAQSRFNTLAAAASLGLGLPALVLALYSADRLVPLISVQRWIAFAPVVVGLLLAAVLAIASAPRGKARVLWLLGATGILVIVGTLLLVAGTLAPS